MKNSLTIVYLLSISLVNCNQAENEVENFFKSAGNIVNIYNKELDDKVKWKELNAAISAIDEFLIKYEGSARDNMKELRATNGDAYNNYVFAVQPLVNWCSSIDRPLNFVIGKLKNQNSLPDRMRNIYKRKLAYIKKRGKQQLKISIEKMELAISNITHLQNTAKDMEYKLENDFKPDGYYGKKKENLRNDKEVIKAGPGSRSRRESHPIALRGIFGVIIPVLLRLVLHPIGISLGLPSAFRTAGVPQPVVDGQQKPSREEEIKIIDSFFKTLSKELNRAQEAAAVVKEGLNKEYKEINLLESDTARVEVEDIVEPELDEDFSEILQSLRLSCGNYVTSHSGSDTKRRRKRDIYPTIHTSSFPRLEVDQFHTQVMKPVHMFTGWKIKFGN